MLLDEIIKLKFLDCIYTSILNFLNKLFILRREQLRVYSHIFKKDDEFEMIEKEWTDLNKIGKVVEARKKMKKNEHLFIIPYVIF